MDNEMGKLPAFQFYPADWLNDIKLQTCSLAAQGLLLNLMCLMHQSEKYGYLLINGSIPSVIDVSHLLRLHHKTYQARLKELILKGVLYEGGNGVIYNKRMVKDEYIRQVRREAGKLGGSPLLKQKVKQEVKQKSTPSSSSSISPSPLKKKEYPDWLDLPLWLEFKKHRKEIKAGMTELAETKAIEKLKRLIDDGNDQEQVLSQSIEMGWKGLFKVKKPKGEVKKAYVYSDCKSCGMNASSIKKGKECPFCGEMVEK